MIKEQLADQIASTAHQTDPALGINREVAQACINAAMSIIRQAVADGETVELRGFGSFGPKRREAKTARNIGANTAIQIPAHTIPVFKPCLAFKAQVRLEQPIKS